MKRDVIKEELVYGLLPSDFLYYLPINKESKVLDVGCGSGVHSFNIADFVSEVYGCDLSKEAVEFCEKRKKNENVKNVQFLNSDIESLHFKDNTFDAIILNTADDFKNGNKLENLRRIYSLLKPGGVLYFGNQGNLKKANKELLIEAGFRKSPSVYIAYPSHHLPRFLIPLPDTEALRFIINSMSAYRGLRGVLARILIKVPPILFLFRSFFLSRAIFVKK